MYSPKLLFPASISDVENAGDLVLVHMSGYVGYASEIDFRVSLDRTIRMVILARVMVLVEIVVDQFAVKPSLYQYAFSTSWATPIPSGLSCNISR